MTDTTTDREHKRPSLDGFIPDYTNQCCNCGESPVVTAYEKGKLVYEGEMCGVCTWGEAACLDPEEWNK